jgi:transposase
MRGRNEEQVSMLCALNPEDLVPQDHPLREVKALADEALKQVDAELEAMYAERGRPSIPPERLLKSMLLMALYSVRSDRMLCEQLQYNLLFRWFLDMDMTERVFDRTVFSHNRERLLEHDVARVLFGAVVEQARKRKLVSSEHFSVDGTLIEAWASKKSFRPKDDDDDDRNGWGDFRGKKRSNETHESKTDPEAKLARKGNGREAKLSYMGHALMENRHGLLVDFDVTEANGYAERQAALTMLDRLPERTRRTLAADGGYDTYEFVEQCRQRGITPHVAQKPYSGVDGRTTRWPGYAVSQRVRKRIEQTFGWGKCVGGLARSRFKGRRRTELSALLIATAYNLLRISRLSPSAEAT